MNVEKSRFVKEKSKIMINVTFNGGISKWSGLVDMALESGHVVKPKNGWYQRVDMKTGEVSEKSYRLKDTMNKDFWDPVLKCDLFNTFVKEKYQIATGDMIEEDNVEMYENLEED